MEAGTNDQLHAQWSVTTDDVLMYPTSSDAGQLSTSDGAGQFVTSHGILQTFATVQLPDGAFQLTAGAFPQVYMAPMSGNFERISPDVVYQTSSQTDDLSQGQTVTDSKQYISVPFLMSSISHNQTQSSSSALYSIPNSLGLSGYTGLLHGIGVGENSSTDLPLGLSMSEGTASEMIATQDLDTGSSMPATSAVSTGQMLQMLSSIYHPTANPVRHLQHSVINIEPAQDGTAILEMELPSQTDGLPSSTGKYQDETEVGGRQETMVYGHLQMTGNCSIVPCSSDDGDLDRLLGDDDYSNADNVVQSALKEEIPVRKSERLAQRERSPSPPVKATYFSKPYSTYELWCEDCQTSYLDECPKHRLVSVYDKVVQSRAWSSLPPVLQIFRLGRVQTEDATTELGVFAKRLIPKRTRFGPFLANLVTDAKSLTKAFLLVVERGNTIGYLDAVDENCCNWMMFVRPAFNYAEQNVVVYQFGNDIYFSTTRNIEPRQELKVWYAAHYAERLGLAVHQPDPCDQKGIDDLELNWPCYECSEKFRTSALLQKHLSEHDEPTLAAAAEAEGGDGISKRLAGRPRKRGHRNSRRQSQAAKNSQKTDDENSADEGSGSFQSWKKKKTRLYLNRMKKYKEPIKRSIRTLHRRHAREVVLGSVDEFTCAHCNLTFNDQVMLSFHTLVHASESVEFGENPDENNVLMQEKDIVDHQLVSFDAGPIECPVCRAVFAQKMELYSHASQHATTQRKNLINPAKPYKCTHCWKAFTVPEKLQRHMLCHADDNLKPLQCQVCKKRFMNNSALACHLKIHSDKKYYECPLCHEGFDQIHVLRTHADKHRISGVFQCPECHKTFDGYHGIRNHMRSFHSEKTYPCLDCGKVFPRSDKLKLHRLRHSAHREFMCETCGRQFKRKDKLHEHTKRMHDPTRDGTEGLKGGRVSSSSKFVPKVSPSDYQRFIYKCHDCLLGFKRRGMLVNHLAKRHPNQSLETVPELNLPILRSQRDYFCQYCEKVYKSSSKRKAHILKNHPGSDLPASARKKNFSDFPGLPNPTFSAPVGNVTTVPHPCDYCHKQYATKAKLLQHQRKKHHDKGATEGQRKSIDTAMIGIEGAAELGGSKVLATTAMISRCINDGSEIQILQQPASIEIGETDLLTQAMSELHQSYGEFRISGQPNAEFQTMVPCIINTSGGTATAALVQTMAGSTVELGQLGHHFAQLQAVQSSTPGNQIIQAVPISLTSPYLQRAWNANNNFQAF